MQSYLEMSAENGQNPKTKIIFGQLATKRVMITTLKASILTAFKTQHLFGSFNLCLEKEGRAIILIVF